MKVAALAIVCLLAAHAQAQTPASTAPPTPPTPAGTTAPPTPPTPPTPAGTTAPPTPPTPAPTARPPVVGPTPAPTARPPSAGPTPAPTPAAPGAPTTTPSGGSSSSGGAVPNAAGLTPSAGSTPTDADILYFAYNLEVFEANFYSCAATGNPISSSITGGGPAPIGCQKANLSSAVGTFAAELSREETAHVTLLYNALTAAGVKVMGPQVDISAATFNVAATKATGMSSLSPQFNPYANDLFFLHGIFIFEDLGTSAYLGALNSISNSSYRLTAAQIAGAEAYHASLDRTQLYQQLNTVAAYGLTVANITSGIVNLINTVAQAPQIDYTIYNQQGSQVTNANSNGLVPAASAQQVLRVVTLGAPAGSGGGFFPNNLNGNVKN